MESVTIRPAMSDDLTESRDIYAEAVIHGTATYELHPPSLDEMRTRFNELADGGFPFLVAAASGEILG